MNGAAGGASQGQGGATTASGASGKSGQGGQVTGAGGAQGQGGKAGSSQGGKAQGGGVNAGGNAQGGDTSGGGQAQGGEAQGGQAQGGGEQGGQSSGGTGQGGQSQGGQAQGGQAQGGQAQGGQAQGGQAQGGQAQGGQAQGGQAQGGCVVDADCAATTLPDTNPTGCAEAFCNNGACELRARDKDGDGDPAKFCKDLSGGSTIAVGHDCDDNDSTRNSTAWDGPEGEGHAAACDGVDNDCTGTADDATLADGTSCSCKPGTIAQCSSDSGGQPISWPGGEPQGACKYGSRECKVDPSTGIAAFGPCTGAVAPVAESCDGLDNDCDGAIDEEDATNKTAWAYDSDGDGHGAAGIAVVQSCTQPPAPTECAALGISCDSAGWKPTSTLVAVSDDCDDANAGRNPGLKEVCDSAGVDEDCNGDANPSWLCSCTEGQSRPCFEDETGKPIPQDPKDATKAIGACKPGQQTCNIDLATGLGTWSLCLNAVGPATELCSNFGTDNDCDGDTNDADDIESWGYDSDNDGHAAMQIAVVKSCGKPTAPPAECAALGLPCSTDGWKLVSTLASVGDCDDANALRNPTAKELCDQSKVDENCDGVANPPALCLCSEGDVENCWVDPNGKTIPQDPNDPTKSLGTCAPGTHTCQLDPLSGLGSWGACQNGVGPADEVCANLGVDNDCDGDATDANDKVPLFCDEDDDGQADQFKETVLGCESAPPPASACGSLPTAKWKPNLNKSDCNDKDPLIKSGIAENCSTVGVDDNCNGTKDENCDCVPGQLRPCFTGPGGVPIPKDPNDPTKSLGICVPGDQKCDATGHWESACNNGVAPGTETCSDEGVDNDCDGDANEVPAGAPLWFCDGDNDGQVAPNAQGVASCKTPTQPCGGAWLQSPVKLDCDDTKSNVYTGAPEVCDGIDNDCDSPTEIDEGAIDAITYYCDYDKDGYVRSDAPTRKACPNTSLPADTCTSALGNGVWISSPKAGDDCNPTNAKVNPGYWDGPGKGVWGIKSPGLSAYYFTGFTYTNSTQTLPANNLGKKDTASWEMIETNFGLFTTPYLATAAGGPFIDGFGVRWVGTIIVPKDPTNPDTTPKTYTFQTHSDDGVRLKVNNLTIIDKWVPQAATTYQGTISLTPGAEVPIELEYFEQTGQARVGLRWAGPLLGDGVAQQTLRLQGPAGQTFTLDGCDGVDNDCDGVIDNQPTTSASGALYRCIGSNGLPVGRPCQPGWIDPCGTTDVGACRLGVSLCQPDGSVGACVGQIDALAKEICDGTTTDWNCNGVPGTAGSADCFCVNGTTQQCYFDNPPCNSHIVQTCNGGSWSGCAPRDRPTAQCLPDNDSDGACASGTAQTKCLAGNSNVPTTEQCNTATGPGGGLKWRAASACSATPDCNDSNAAETPLNPLEFNATMPVNAKGSLCNKLNDDCANPTTPGVDSLQVCESVLAMASNVTIPISTLLHGDRDFGNSSNAQLGVKVTYSQPNGSSSVRATFEIMAKETGGDVSVGKGSGYIDLPANGAVTILSPNLTGSMSCGYTSCAADTAYYTFATAAPGSTTTQWSVQVEQVSGVFNPYIGFNITCTGLRSGGDDICVGADCMVCTVSASTVLGTDGVVRVRYN